MKITAYVPLLAIDPNRRVNTDKALGFARALLAADAQFPPIQLEATVHSRSPRTKYAFRIKDGGHRFYAHLLAARPYVHATFYVPDEGEHEGYA